MASVVISGDSSGTITLSAPSVAGSNTATLPASTGNVLLDSSTGVCRAWVNFNGTLTTPITPRAAFNVSSITKNGTGDYTANFTNALADANYATVCSGLQGSATPYITYTASAIRVATTATYYSAASADLSIVSIAVFR